MARTNELLVFKLPLESVKSPFTVKLSVEDLMDAPEALFNSILVTDPLPLIICGKLPLSKILPLPVTLPLFINAPDIASIPPERTETVAVGAIVIVFA